MLLNTFKHIHVYEHIFSHAMLFWTTLMDMLSIFTLELSIYVYITIFQKRLLIAYISRI